MTVIATSSYQIFQSVVSSTGQIITETYPYWVIILALIISFTALGIIYSSFVAGVGKVTNKKRY